MNYLVINFKTYKKASGKNAEVLAKIADSISILTKKKIILVVQETDIYRISRIVSIPVFSEHLDPIEYGAHTGKILAQSLVFNGAKGVVLNHSEDRFTIDKVIESIKLAKKNRLKTLVCVNTPENIRLIKKFKPDFIAIEPPELIGSNKAVSRAKPELITKSAELLKRTKIKLLCGAGIKTDEDVKKALDLGAKGVFVASGIVNAKNQTKKILELVKHL